QPIEPIHPELEEPLNEVLGPTYGLIVYQEQVQLAARVLAGYTLGGADLLRRAMGKKKKEVLDKEFIPFQAGMRGNGYSDEAIQAVWDVLVPFAGYAFNKSHSAAYGLVSYWTAYLKANYPAEYMAALLTSVGDDKDKMGVYLSETRRMGIKVLSPDVNESAVEFTAVGDDIRFGLTAVRNVGANVVESLMKTRKSKGKYTSFQDFLSKVEITVCNKRTIDSLIKAGAFDSLGHTRKSLCAVHETAVDAVIGLKRQEANGQFDLFGAGGDEPDDKPAVGLDFKLSDDEWSRKQLLSTEREMLGLYVSSHPLDGAEHILARNRDMSIAELVGSGQTEGFVKLAGLITGVDRRINKGGNPWAIITLSDHDASIEVLYFPKNYLLFAQEFIEDNAVSIRGRINERDGALSVFGEELVPLDISAAEHGGRPPVVLKVHERRVTPDLVRRLKSTILAHPGDTEVRLRMENRLGGTTLLRLNPTVENNTAFASEIKVLLGPDSWVV
ncbi:MAG TPA: OB-fold nucleic acid binding domain-containing protein, partial [Yinghuangia sp.]|nr:OB-fold nucleic acid binding domain-containing protein [Yinghuangia sp.]